MVALLGGAAVQQLRPTDDWHERRFHKGSFLASWCVQIGIVCRVQPWMSCVITLNPSHPSKHFDSPWWLKAGLVPPCAVRGARLLAGHRCLCADSEPCSFSLAEGPKRQKMAKIIYTHTDEAPMLATYSLLPIIQAGCKPSACCICNISKAMVRSSNVRVETSDISVAARRAFVQRLLSCWHCRSANEDHRLVPREITTSTKTSRCSVRPWEALSEA